MMYEMLDLDAVHFRKSYLKHVMKLVNDYDHEILAQPAVGSAFGDESAECFAHGPDALIADADLLYRRWAFDVSTIQRPVHVWQGTDDHLVPLPDQQAGGRCDAGGGVARGQRRWPFHRRR